jgi:hypothetical protein
VREEFSSVYKQQLKVVSERERISKELEGVGEDMAKMQVGAGFRVQAQQGMLKRGWGRTCRRCRWGCYV